MSVVSFQSTIETLLSINDADSYVEATPAGAVDCTFNVRADLNGAFGSKYGLDSIKMPYNLANNADQTAQDGKDEFSPDDIVALRARLLPILLHEDGLVSSASGSSSHGAGGDVTYFTQMKTQLMNLFDNMALTTVGGGDAIIGDGSVRIKDSRVTQFLTTTGGEDTMVTKTFLDSQIAQLLEAAARDASRYVAIGTVADGTYQHELKMHQGDRLSCIVVVQAKSSTHGNEPYVNTQTWRVEFEQDDAVDHTSLY